MSVHARPRGLGPFSSGHLTVIAITLLLLIAFPFAAFAVTGNNVFLTDAATGTRARVDPQHQLAASVHDAATGRNVKVGADGRLATNVAGTIGAAVTFPTKDLVRTPPAGSTLPIANECPGGQCALLLAPPAGKALIVTSIHVDTFKATATGTGKFIDIVRSTDGSCTQPTLGDEVDAVNPPHVGVTTLNYILPGGLPVPAGTALCAFSADAANVQAFVDAVGYAVPPSLVPVAAVVPGARRAASHVQQTGGGR